MVGHTTHLKSYHLQGSGLICQRGVQLNYRTQYSSKGIIHVPELGPMRSQGRKETTRFRYPEDMSVKRLRPLLGIDSVLV